MCPAQGIEGHARARDVVRKKTAMTTMEAAIVFPLLPGKRLALAEFISELTGARRASHDRSHGLVIRESWFMQPTPAADLVIVYLESPDPMEVFAELAVSKGEFEVWFRAQVRELTGMDLTMLPPFCLPTRILHRVRGEATDGTFETCDVPERSQSHIPMD